jgi:hypothetical protein
MRLSMRALGGRLPLAILVACAGCGSAGDGLPREAIWGNVTLDGQPLAMGVITFTPSEGQATQSGGVVTGGKFSVPRDQGPVPGKYAVSISSASAEAQVPPEEAKTGMPGYVTPGRKRDPIPDKYNTNTTLTAEVKKGGGNSFQFDLKTK